jgi:hypothetical protein
LTGGPPGSCAIDLVRLVRSPLWTLVWVCDLLHTPPGSCAWSIDCPLRLLPFPCTPLRLIVRPLGAAALPPVPRVDDEVLGVVEVAPRPSEEAEVSPAAALPPEPTTPLALPGLSDPAPVPTVDAAAPGSAALPPAAQAVLV